MISKKEQEYWDLTDSEVLAIEQREQDEMDEQEYCSWCTYPHWDCQCKKAPF